MILILNFPARYARNLVYKLSSYGTGGVGAFLAPVSRGESYGIPQKFLKIFKHKILLGYAIRLLYDLRERRKLELIEGAPNDRIISGRKRALKFDQPRPKSRKHGAP